MVGLWDALHHRESHLNTGSAASLCMLSFSFLKSGRICYPCIALSVKKHIIFTAIVTGHMLRVHATLQLCTFIQANLCLPSQKQVMLTERPPRQKWWGFFQTPLFVSVTFHPLLADKIKQTSRMKKKLIDTHEYWLESFLPISGQFIFWRSIRIIQMKRMKFICGGCITRVMWEKYWGIWHCKNCHNVLLFCPTDMQKYLRDLTHKRKPWVVVLPCGDKSISKRVIWVGSLNWQHLTQHDALPAKSHLLSTERHSETTEIMSMQASF